MDAFEAHPDEGLISCAIRRRNLPTEHPAHLTPEQYREFMQAGIAAMKARSKLIQEALTRAGKLDARI